MKALLLTSGIALFSLFGGTKTQSAEKPSGPNIVIILADDKD
jgi:hypothetical protein